jgi:hypothetical protein
VKMFDVPKSNKHKPVDRAWLDAFLSESDKDGLPHLSACVFFMHQTAARVSEAVNLPGEHVDMNERIAALEKTKTEEWSVRHLTAELVARLSGLGLRMGRGFSAIPTGRQSIAAWRWCASGPVSSNARYTLQAATRLERMQ